MENKKSSFIGIVLKRGIGKINRSWCKTCFSMHPYYIIQDFPFEKITFNSRKISEKGQLWIFVSARAYFFESNKSSVCICTHSDINMKTLASKLFQKCLICGFN